MSKYINEDQQLSQSHSQPQPPQQPPELGLGSLQTSMMEPLRILEPAESRIMVSLEAIELTSNFDDVSEHNSVTSVVEFSGRQHGLDFSKKISKEK